MRLKKGRWTGLLAAALLCQSIFAPAAAGLEGKALTVHAAANVALNKPVTVSALEMEGQYTGDLAVDGISDSDTSRWSGGQMKDNSGAHVSDQWLVIDLKARKTAVESIHIWFYRLVWSTEYVIQTSDTADGAWEDVHTVTNEAAATQNLENSITSGQVPELKRYVRFYFKTLNHFAGGNAISVREISIMGMQEGVLNEISSAQEVLNRITELTVSESDRQLNIPQVSEDYDVVVHGSEVDKVIADDGSIAPLHIGERSMNIILQATSKTDASDTAKKNITVTVPDNSSEYPQLFKSVSQPNPMPDVLPTIQEWYGYEGNFTLKKNSRIVVNDHAGVDLAGVASEMQADLKDICGFELPVVTAAEGTADDIYLESQTEDVYGTGEEGYLLVNGDQGIQIYSSSRTGALYGTVTVEQILYQEPSHTNVPKGVIRDYPLYAVRGIMFDVARIPTRMQFLEDYTKILKWYKLNEMQMHLNDNQWSEPAYSSNPSEWMEVEASHRLESETFPSLAKQDSKFQRTGDKEGRYDYYYNIHTGMKEKTGEAGELYYTKEEYRKLEKSASDRGVTLVAELDTPGHSAAYTKYVYTHQEEVIKSLVEKKYLERADYLDNSGELKAGVSFYIHNPNNFELLAIDEQSSDATVKQNAVNARIFMKALFDEYLGGDDPLFTADTVSAGVDEYWDKGGGNKEAFRRYMNYMYDLLGETEGGYGKEVRMWGALGAIPGSTQPNKNIVLDIWATYEDDPIARIADGFSVINIPQPYLYTTPGRYHKDMVNEEYIYYNWDPVIFNGSVQAQKGEPLLKGAMAALWGDENREGITEADLNERYLRVAAIVSEKTWGGTKADDTFLEYEQTFDRLREGPGTQIANQIDSKTNIVVDYDFENISKDGKVVYDASGNGYHGTIKNGTAKKVNGETMLKFDGTTTIETPLQSLGYPYTMSFDVYLDGSETNTAEASLFSGYDGRLQLAGIDGQLSLNRDYFGQSFGYAVPDGEKHRITVVGTYQATKLYVDGQFVKILYAAASDPDHGGNIGASTWTDADNNYRTTFVFPMNVIGKGFSGCLGNIRAYNKALFTEELAADTSLSNSEVDVARNRGAYADNHNPAFWTEPHSASAIRLYPAWKATDGDGHVTGVDGASTSNESRWNSSDYDGDFLMVDLGQNRSISKVVIDWEAGRYGTSYNIQVSKDGEHWTTVKQVTGNTSAWTEDTFDETEARYVKMQGVQRKSGSNEYCIYEIKVYGTVNKDSLKNKLQEVKALLAGENAGWESTGGTAALYDGMVEAQAVYNDVMAGQEEADAAVAALEQAVADWNAVDEELNQTVSDIKKDYADLSGYTTESAKTLTDALAAAEAVLKNPAASHAAKESALKELQDAVSGLVKVEKPSTEAAELTAVVASSKQQYADLSGYTSDSANVYSQALKEAERVLANPAATQAQIKAALEKLNAAILGLKKQQAVTPPADNNGGNTKPDPSVSLKNGDTAVFNKMLYKVVNAKKKTAVLVKNQNKKAKKVSIPDAVKINGTVCKVTQISANAFKNCRTLKSVIIGKNIRTIGKKAFYGCSKLGKITFKSTKVTKIKNQAFKKTNAKMKAYAPKKMKKSAWGRLQKALKKSGISKKTVYKKK